MFSFKNNIETLRYSVFVFNLSCHFLDFEMFRIKGLINIWFLKLFDLYTDAHMINCNKPYFNAV